MRSDFFPEAFLDPGAQANRLNLATLIGQEPGPDSTGPYSTLQLGSTFDVPLIPPLAGIVLFSRSDM
jgi:hypothetical protein